MPAPVCEHAASLPMCPSPASWRAFVTSVWPWQDIHSVPKSRDSEKAGLQSPESIAGSRRPDELRLERTSITNAPPPRLALCCPNERQIRLTRSYACERHHSQSVSLTARQPLGQESNTSILALLPLHLHPYTLYQHASPWRVQSSSRRSRPIIGRRCSSPPLLILPACVQDHCFSAPSRKGSSNTS